MDCSFGLKRSFDVFYDQSNGELDVQQERQLKKQRNESSPLPKSQSESHCVIDLPVFYDKDFNLTSKYSPSNTLCVSLRSLR